MTWQRVPIKEIADVESGFGFPRRFQGILDAEYPFFKVADMNTVGNESEMRISSNTVSKEILRKLNAKVFPPGTVIYPKIGAAIATNKKRILIHPSVVDNNVMCLIPRKGVVPWYLFYWMQQFDLRSVANVGPVPSMRKSDMQRVVIPLPTPNEQRRIVDILQEVDALRKQRSKAESKAIQILPALFYQMFGDPILNTKNFPKVKLGDTEIAEINPSTKSLNLPENTEVSFVPMAVIDERWGTVSDYHIRRLADVKKGFTTFLNNDVLFAKITPCMENGKVAIARNLRNELGYGSTEFHILRSGKLVTPEWIYGLLRLSVFRNLAKGSFTGSVGHQRVPASFLRSFNVPLPPKKLIRRFSVFVSDLLQGVQNRQKVKREIEMMFKTTLHRAFCGELTASWRQTNLNELNQGKELQLEETRS